MMIEEQRTSPSPVDEIWQEQSHASLIMDQGMGDDAPAPESLPVTASSELLTTIRVQWATLVAQLADVHHALPYLLEGGRAQQCADGVLTIGFRYRLHAEKVQQPKMLDAVTAALRVLTGQELRVVTVVVNAEEFATLEAVSRPATGDAVADAALEVFGGRVVE